MSDDPITLSLPWPPSVNHYLRHVALPIGKRCGVCKRFPTRNATLISEPGRAWLRLADAAILDAAVQRVSGPVAVSILLNPPDRRSIDVDNRVKPVLDAMKRRPKDAKQCAWVFAEDDRQVKRIACELSTITTGGRCTVTVTKMNQPQNMLPFGQP